MKRDSAALNREATTVSRQVSIALLATTLAAATPWCVTSACAQGRAALPERLLTPADLERVGLKGSVRPSPEMFDPAEGLHFVRATDSTLVLAVNPLPSARTSTELRTTVQLLSKDVTPVAGVGDEAYSALGGWLLVFRKGTTTIQLLTGANMDTMGKAFLSVPQLTELAKTVAGRL